MCKSTFVGVFIICVASVGVRCDSYYYGDDLDDDSDGPGPAAGLSDCDAENQHALSEIKSELQDVRQLLIGLRTKLDPDFKQTPPPESKCPTGFQYVKRADRCYKIVYKPLNWAKASQKCHDLHPTAHLVAITTEAENIGLLVYLKKELAKNSRRNGSTFQHLSTKSMLWTSGQRLTETNCSDEFVWKVSNDTHLPLSYTYWNRDEPNCHGRTPESCLELRSSYEFKWNDVPCDFGLFPLCECNPL